MSWGQGGGINGSESFAILLGRIDERTQTTADDVRDIKHQLRLGDERMDETDRRIDRGDRRADELMTAIAALKISPQLITGRPRLMLALSALTGVAPLKEWLFGAVVVVFALKGFITPADVKALILEYWI